MANYVKKFGAIFSPVDVRDYKGVSKVSYQEFPDEFELEMPAVKNQGNVGSCVAHAISVVVEYFSRAQGDDTREMSVGYIYGNRTNSAHKGAGMVTREALQSTTSYGDVPKEVFPYNKEVPEIIDLFKANVEQLFPQGYGNRITSYYRLNSEADIKAALVNNGPVIFAMNWFSDMRVIDGVLTTAYKKWEGSHCMVIYGWDKRGWKIQNSWGTYWGNRGRCIIPYDIEITEFWGIVDSYSENLNRQRIKELTEQCDALQLKIEELTNIIDELNIKLSKAIQENSALTQEHLDVIGQLTSEITKLQQDINSYKTELSQKTQEIELLQKQLIEIKKPYDSAIGQFIAKVINGVIDIISSIIKFFKRKH